MNAQLVIRIADEQDLVHASTISNWYETSSKERGTGIAIRSPDYLTTKIVNGNGIIAFVEEELAGFCYVEVFSSGEYVSNSGLIVNSKFRKLGFATQIKKVAFNHARNTNKEAKVFGITTSDFVMNINSNLGYRPVSFSQLTRDVEFWKGCNSCKNYDILLRNDKNLCLCTGMLAPSQKEVNKKLEQNDKNTK